jgi:signal transduction histidine kinase
MKLLTKTGLNFISASIFFFLFGSLGGYYFIRYAVNKLLNNELLEVKKTIESNPHGVKTISYADVLIDTIAAKDHLPPTRFSDTVLFRHQSQTYEFYRTLTFYEKDDHQTIQYSILRPSAPSDLMIMKFTLMLTIFPVLFFLILYFVNRASTKYSLSVFYDTIQKLKSFDVNKDNRLELMTSDVDEFEQLNDVFNALDKKIREDYERLKEYTENTSHELQTPLAIITSRLDELLQADNLSQGQMKSIAGMIETVNRLSKMNQSLIFLAKLDNRIFSNEETVNFEPLINAELELLQPLIENKQIQINVNIQQALRVKMNQSLAHTLVQNLLRNAIRHNLTKGYISISLSPHELVIENSGHPIDFDPDELFTRFRSNSKHPQSLGIGLSIVKRICDISNIDINYKASEKSHQFILRFK